MPLAVRRSSPFHPSLVKKVLPSSMVWGKLWVAAAMSREASGSGKADAMREGGVNIR